uniref:Uncharacterized protein n=1 Tax=Bionectria ochroleuca TaxID=29856 RepID=A0A8H7NF04_BIOOC
MARGKKGKAAKEQEFKKKLAAYNKAKQKERVKGSQRFVPCLGCLKSCLGGKQVPRQPRGGCFDLKPAGKRCFLCASGHSCVPIPPMAYKAAMKYLSARDKRQISEMTKWRAVVRGMLEIAEEEKNGDGNPNADLAHLNNEQLYEAGRAAALRLFDTLWRDDEERAADTDEEFEEWREAGGYNASPPPTAEDLKKMEEAKERKKKAVEKAKKTRELQKEQAGGSTEPKTGGAKGSKEPDDSSSSAEESEEEFRSFVLLSPVRRMKERFS